MRLVAQSIQEKHIEPLKLLIRGLGNFAVVGEISRRSEAKSINFSFAVNQAHRLESRAKQIHRTIDREQLQHRASSILVIGVKDIAEHPAQKRGGIGPRIKR